MRNYGRLDPQNWKNKKISVLIKLNNKYSEKNIYDNISLYDIKIIKKKDHQIVKAYYDYEYYDYGLYDTFNDNEIIEEIKPLINENIIYDMLKINW